MARTTIRRGLFGFLGQPAEKPEAVPAPRWWKAQPVDDGAGEADRTSTNSGMTSAAPATYSPANPASTTSPALRVNESAAVTVKPPVESDAPPATENLDDSVHQLVVPAFIRRKASVGPVPRAAEDRPPTGENPSLPSAAAEETAPATPAESYVGKYVEKTAAAAPGRGGGLFPLLPADERFSISLTLLGWVGVAGIVLAVAGGLGYYAGLARGNRPAAVATPTPASPTINAVKAGPVKSGVTNLSGGKAAPAATPGKKPLDLPLAAPNLEKGKRYIVIQEGLAGEDEAADIIRFLKENGETQVGALKYRLGNASKWRVVSLKPWDAKDTPLTKKEMDDYKRKIETLGQKYKKSGGHHEFLRPYDRTF